MIAACRQAGRKLGIFVQCRLREPIQQMRLALQQGRFGRLLRADAVMKWYRTTEYYLNDAWRTERRSGAGVTIQHAFHYIDLLQYLAGPGRIGGGPDDEPRATRKSRSKTPLTP